MVSLVKTFSWPGRGVRLVLLLTVAVCVSYALAADETTLNTPDLQPAMLSVTGTHSLWQNDPNLTGSGVLIAAVCRSQSYINDKPMNDYRFNMGHNSLFDADVVFEDGTDGHQGLSGHATALAGILLGLDEEAGDPALGSFQYRGACPDASVNAFQWQEFVLRYLYRKQPIEADILTLSLGDIFELPWTRAIEQLAADEDLIVIAGIGNGDDAHTPVLYPAAGANAIGVGVVDAVVDAQGNVSLSEFSLPTEAHSSTGPTDNQRCKPDLVAPGTALVPSHDDRAGYQVQQNWTSLAAPAVSGTVALLLQKAEQTPDLQKAFNKPGKSSVIKAILLNSARKLPFWHKGNATADDDHDTPLDYTQGAGLVDAQAAMAQLNGDWDNAVLNRRNPMREYPIEVTEPNQFITATLCWSRFYQDSYPFRHDLDRDTDLRLELWGRIAGDPNEVLVDYSDSINDNVEHLYLQADGQYTEYTLRVRFNDQQKVTSTTRQRYAIAFSVGDDQQVDNDWWGDLNGDGTMDDPMDQIIAALLNTGGNETLSTIDNLNLTADRAALLIQHWDNWKQYVN
ncbi:MAG: S8 family serine peptidase [Planctomycetota bacterium]